jgi:hypothetical protein
MPLLVKLDNKRLWDKPEWLPPGEVPAQAFLDFKLDNHEMSVWYVAHDNSNLDRVLTALAANRQYIEKIDYAVFDEAVVSKCGIARRQTHGQSPDEHASKEWHWDLIKLSGRKLLCLAERIGAGTPLRKPKHEVQQLLAAAALEGHIKKELMNETLAVELDWPLES